jgi:hypothetical protein
MGMRPADRHIFAPQAARWARAAEPGGQIAGWREQRLRHAGVEAELAAAIASDCAIDLHAMIELIERGCPPELALRILAPFDHERNPC